MKFLLFLIAGTAFAQTRPDTPTERQQKTFDAARAAHERYADSTRMMQSKLKAVQALNDACATATPMGTIHRNLSTGAYECYSEAGKLVATTPQAKVK